MRKKNEVKFPEKLPKDPEAPTVIETAEEAVEIAVAEAESRNVSPSAINVSFKDGYVNGLGEVFGADGISAPPTKPRPSEAVTQIPAKESYAPEPKPELKVAASSPEPKKTPAKKVEAKEEDVKDTDEDE